MTPELLAQLGQLREAPPAPPLPTDMIVKCALSTCENTFRITDAYGFILSMAKRGPNPNLASIVCPDPREIKRGNLASQHFGCCEEHAFIAIVLCGIHHLLKPHVAEVQLLAQLAQQVKDDGTDANESASKSDGQ